jgi:arginyl-tRNA synthetase
MKILSTQLKPLFIEAAKAAFPELETEILLDVVGVEEPKDPSHGDYACTAPFKLAKILGKKPADIGQAIVDNFPEDDRVGSVEFMMPGFVNLRLAADFLESELSELEHGFSLEREDVRRDKPVIVEYSSTNAAKHMGVHHLITTVLGDVLANLFEFMGEDVIRINHLGDWGTNFGKLIYAVENWGDKKKIRENPNDELTKLYVQFNNKADKKPELDEDARKIFKSLEEGDAKRMNMWKWIVTESVTDLEHTFKRMGVHFDHIMGESTYLKMADEVIEDGLAKGLFVEGEGGALIFDMGEDQVPAMLRKSDGATLYLTRDVAAIKYRVERWQPANIVYVVDHAQSLHFKQDFAVARAMGYAGDSELEHVQFGRMRFNDRSMSTRKGNVIKITKLFDEAAKKAQELSEQRGGYMHEEQMREQSELIGVSSVKYAILSQDRVKDIIFEWDKIITLEGNSAPYLLYSYARAHSIVRKVGDLPLSGKPKLTEEAEISMVRFMLKFPDILANATAERKPHMIAFFLYEMCQEFNRFYGAVSVVNADSEEAKRTRLGIVHSFMHILKSGLSVFGIPVLEEM